MKRGGNEGVTKFFVTQFTRGFYQSSIQNIVIEIKLNIMPESIDSNPQSLNVAEESSETSPGVSPDVLPNSDQVDLIPETEDKQGNLLIQVVYLIKPSHFHPKSSYFHPNLHC